MDFSPGLDKALLCPRQPAANTFDWVQSERGQCVLIQRVEVRPMVRGTDFHEHSNDDSEEPRQFRHRDTLHRQYDWDCRFVGPTNSRQNLINQYACEGRSVARRGRGFNVTDLVSTREARTPL